MIGLSDRMLINGDEQFNKTIDYVDVPDVNVYFYDSYFEESSYDETKFKYNQKAFVISCANCGAPVTTEIIYRNRY